MSRSVSWASVLVWAAVIFYFSSISRPLPEDIQKIFPDWFLHGVEYGVFGALLVHALFLTFPRQSDAWLFRSAVLIGGIYGGSDEWHQSFVPYREVSVRDWIVDVFAVCLAAALYLVMHGYTLKKRNEHA